MMILSRTALGFGVALASLAVAPAVDAKAQQQAEVAATTKQPRVSEAARKEIVALQNAVNAKDAAALPAALAAAQAKAKTNDDKYIVGKLQLKAAADANDNAAIGRAIEAILASGFDVSSESAVLYNNLGKIYFNAKAYDRAAVALERLIQLQPSNVEALVLLAEVRNEQGRTADSVAMIQKAIAARTAAGQKAEESWYKRSVALAFNGKLPTASALSRDWVAAYPNAKNWRDAIRIYQQTSNLDDAALIDSMRLAQATGALSGENDYYRFANQLMLKGFPGEAKAVLEQGFAAKTIDKSKATFSQMYASATAKSQGDRASLAASASTAKAGGDAKKVMVIADAYYGYGDYAQAADLYRAALGKAGADKDLANLRLGMALARSGDKAGATAALNAVGGAQAEVAKLWLTYLATKA